MAYPTPLPLVKLEFSDGFKYYGTDTTVTPSATVNLSVPTVTHQSTGETLTDGETIPAQTVADFHVPRVDRTGWRTPNGSTLSGWSYDVAVTIAATGKPPILWSTTITPGANGETITPGMGELTGGGKDAAAPELLADFRTMPDGPVPTTFPTGQAFTHAATTPVIEGGAFTTPAVDGTRTATYLEPALGGKLTRVGAEFVIRRETPEQTNGALAMGAWSNPGVVATYPGAFPVAGAHFVINRDRWYYNFYGDADSADVASATFKTPLAEGVPHRVELSFDGPRVVIDLPDASRATFTDPRAEQYINNRPFWEPFMERGNTDTNIGITQVWADSDNTGAATDRYASKGELATVAATAHPGSYSVKWHPAGDRYINLPDYTAPTAVHSDLWVDVPVPESRMLVITATAGFEKNGAAVPYWMFTANTSQTLGIVRLSPITGTETVTSQLFVDLRSNGAMKAGNTIRIGWSHYKSGVDRVTLQATNGRWPTMTVTPVTGRVVTAG